MFCPYISIDDFNENDTCDELLDTLREIQIPPQEFFVECKYQNQVVKCASVFEELVNGFALCYRFNGLEYYRADVENHNELLTPNWNIDDGYKTTASLNTYPRRAFGAGKQFELSILLKMNWRDFGFTCSTEPGFWVYFTAGANVAISFNPIFSD
jgi:acid-sensing ion channel, other